MSKQQNKNGIFKADTTLQGIFEDIIQQLAEKGWDNDFVILNQGNGRDSYRFGVLLRDIPNPIFVKESEKKQKDFSRFDSAEQNHTDIQKYNKTTKQQGFIDSKNRGSKSLSDSVYDENFQNNKSVEIQQYEKNSLKQVNLQISRFGTKREKSEDDIKTLQPALQRALAGQKTVGFKQPYGEKRFPNSFFEPARPIEAVISNYESVVSETGKSVGELVTRLSDIQTISHMRYDSSALTIAIDTEFYTVGNERYILTWQFAFSDTDKSIIHEIVFFSLNGERLHLSMALSWLIDKYSLHSLPFAKQRENGYLIKNARRWSVPVPDGKNKCKIVVCKSYKEALKVCDDSYRKRLVDSTGLTANGKKIYHKLDNALKDNDVGYYNSFEDFNQYAIPVTLLFHAGIADLPSFGFVDFDSDVLIHTSSVSGGIVSLKCFYLYPTNLLKHWYFRPIKVNVRDTLCYAPGKKRSLEILGEAIGVPKLELIKGYDKADMRRYLMERPLDFLEYAINDSVVTLCYASELWDYNTTMPVTISSASVKASLPILKEVFNCGDDLDKYNLYYRGLKRENLGLYKKDHKNGKSGYSDYKSLKPLNDDANLLQSYAKNAYMGGYNASIDIGWFEGSTYDYDLRNAYATSMALCFDIEWTSERLIFHEWKNQRMNLFDFRTPYDPIFGYFKFRFPDNVKYPCIPVSVNGSIVYPREYVGKNELDGVYASGPEIYLALKLGAEVTAVRAVQGLYRLDENGFPSHSLQAVVKGFVNDRNLAKKAFGEGSLAEILIKEAMNCVYGKVSQGIKEKKSWNAYSDYMEKIGGSEITSPVHASIITSGVRACLLATMNQLNDKGYRVFSVTTDGFISSAPFDVVKNLDLYGFRNLFESARMEMTGNPEMWQIKHAEKALLNFTTRGNVALNTIEKDPIIIDGVKYGGVCAHNSYVTGIQSDTYEDRLALTKVVLSRTGRCRCNTKSFASFRDVARWDNRKDFFVDTIERNISMDFDLKRKPIFDSFQTVYPVVDGVQYEIANFTTEPYQTIDEFKKYKEAGLSHIKRGCLLTQNDWDTFLLKVVGKEEKKAVNARQTRHISDIEWSRIVTLVMGHRLGYWSIPYLASKSYSLQEKLAFINSLNKSKKVFDLNNWKNSRKVERVAQMLPFHMIADLLLEADAIIKEVNLNS